MQRVIHLARHGAIQKPGPKKSYIGGLDLPLSWEGHHQAADLAEKLKPIPLSAVYCSDLRRSAATADYIAKIHGLIPIQIPQFREIGLGQWEGVPFETIQNEFPEAYAQRGREIVHFRPPGGESFMDLALRVIPTLFKIASAAEGDIAIVGHAGVNRVILSQARSADLKELFNIPQAYACLNRIAFHNGSFSML